MTPADTAPIDAAVKKATELNDAAVKQVTELNDKLVADSKRAGNLYLDGVDASFTGFATFEKKIAAQVPNDLVKGVLDAHADLVTQLTKSYTSIAREALA